MRKVLITTLAAVMAVVSASDLAAQHKKKKVHGDPDHQLIGPVGDDAGKQFLQDLLVGAAIGAATGAMQPRFRNNGYRPAKLAHVPRSSTVRQPVARTVKQPHVTPGIAPHRLCPDYSTPTPQPCD